MATRDKKNSSELGGQAIALAEQLGRMAGTIEGAAQTWLIRQKLAEQLAQVRDSAAQMLEGLTEVAARRRPASKRKSGKTTAAGPRQSDPARAPGKRRRKPGPTKRGVKKSDERIPKMKSAAAARQRRKSYA